MDQTEFLLGDFSAIPSDFATIESALQDASIPVLLMSMIHMSGDLSILDGDLRPAGSFINELQGFMSEEDKAKVRHQAMEVIREFIASGCELPPTPDNTAIHRMMNFLVAEQVPEEYVPMLLEELGLDDRNSRSEQMIDELPDKNHVDHTVLVIGGGMSGILIAIQLKQAGIPFIIVEKNDTIGGTWLENQYPGVRVDVSNHLYSYSFEPAHHWTEYFAQQAELLTYFKNVVEKYALEDCCKLNTEVVSAQFNEATQLWAVEVSGASGTEHITVNSVVSAVGQLNRPQLPNVAGLESFKGQWCHTAQWDHSIELDGKKVAVIGAGASAFQLVPAVANRAEQLTVFQRTAPWMFENPNYHEPVPEGLKWCLKHLPFYARWYRFLLFWPSCDGAYDSVIVDPEWPNKNRAASELNHAIRELFTDYISSQVGDDEVLLEKVLPDYPPMARRTLQDNGSWLAALKQDTVSLEKQGIAEVTEQGVIAEDGSFHPADVIVYATGFQANKFLWPMDIKGRAGKQLSAVWQEDPSAYLGLTVSGFPNFYCMFGPGTNLAFGGSLIFNAECQARYIVSCLHYLISNNKSSLEVKEQTHEEYQRRFREQHAKLIWELPDVKSYYKNSNGKVTLLWPWKIIDMWRWTKCVDSSDYTFE